MKKFGRYTKLELAQKIEWEGFASFFLDYESAGTFSETPIAQEVQQFVSAYEALVTKLASLGVGV